MLKETPFTQEVLAHDKRDTLYK